MNIRLILFVGAGLSLLYYSHSQTATPKNSGMVERTSTAFRLALLAKQPVVKDPFEPFDPNKDSSSPSFHAFQDGEGKIEKADPRMEKYRNLKNRRTVKQAQSGITGFIKNYLDIFMWLSAFAFLFLIGNHLFSRKES